MSDRKLRELERQLRREPQNLAVRLQLAALHQDAGRRAEALEQYRAVVAAYRADGRVQQAVAVARSALSIAPDDAELVALVAGRAPGDSGRTGAGPAPVETVATGPTRSARMLDGQVTVRELEPMRPDPTARVGDARRGGFAPGRGTGPIETQTPSGLFTPTPLPIPIAYHEADPSIVHSLVALEETDPARRDSGPVVDTLPDGPSSGRVTATRPSVDSGSSAVPVLLDGDDLSVDLDTRRRPRVAPAVLDLLGVPPTGQTPAIEPIASEPTTVEDEPTIPPDPGRARPTVTLDEDGWSEEPTDPRDEPLERTDTGMFDRPLGVTVAALGPGGTPRMTGFATLPDAARRGVLATAVVRTFAAGAPLVREGDAGETLFVIDSGQVQVVKRSAARAASLAGATIEVGRLGPGDVVGEIAVMSDRRRHATALAIGEVRALEVSRAAVAAAAADHPEVAELLDELVRERLLANVMAIAPFFAPLPTPRRAAVLARFRPRKVAAGTLVLRQGAPRQGLVIVLLGALELVVRCDDGRMVRAAAIPEGAHVGDLALLGDVPEPATARAAVPSELVMLHARDFYELVNGEPELWQALRAQALRRANELADALRKV